MVGKSLKSPAAGARNRRKVSVEIRRNPSHHQTDKVQVLFPFSAIGLTNHQPSKNLIRYVQYEAYFKTIDSAIQ